eukprot:796579-Amorphochlora_amoeboformis.AAC.1
MPKLRSLDMPEIDGDPHPVLPGTTGWRFHNELASRDATPYHMRISPKIERSAHIDRLSGVV